MVLQSLSIVHLNPLQNLHNNRSKPFAVEVHFLVIGDLADIAVKRKLVIKDIFFPKEWMGSSFLL